jgi:hypothetical protein
LTSVELDPELLTYVVKTDSGALGLAQHVDVNQEIVNQFASTVCSHYRPVLEVSKTLLEPEFGPFLFITAA